MKKLIFSLLAILPCFYVGLSAQTLAEAQRLSRNEQFEDADSIYRVLINKNPKKPDFYYYAGLNLIYKGDSAGALSLFDEGLAKAPTNPFIMVGKGHMALRAGNIAAAEQFFTKASAAKKKVKLVVHKEIARCYLLVDFGSKDQILAHAKKAFDNLKLASETDIEVNLLRGEALSIINPSDLSNAVVEYTIAKNNAETDPRPVTMEGRAYTRVGNYLMATAKADDALAIDKEFAPAYRLKAEAFAKMKMRDSAIHYYEEYLKRNNNFTARKFYVVTLFQTRDWDKTIEQADVLLSQKDNAYVRGIKSFAIGEKTDATKELLNEGINEFSQFENNYVKVQGRKLSSTESYYKALLYARVGDDGKMETSFNVISPVLMDTAKASERMYTRMQDVYWNAKQYDKTYQVIEMKKMKLKDSLNIKDMFYAAVCLTRMERHQDALGLYQQIVKQDTNYVDGYNRIATTWAVLDRKDTTGNVTTAYLKWISKLDSAALTVPRTKVDVVNAYKNLAHYALQKKDYETAIMYWGKVLAIKPDDAAVIEVKQKYEDYVAKLKKRSTTATKGTTAGTSTTAPGAGGKPSK